MPTPSQNGSHFNRLDKYARAIDELYRKAILEASKLISLASYDPDKPFSFDDFPMAKTRMNRILEQLTGDLHNAILKSTDIEWNFSNDENDALVRTVFPGVPDEDLKKYMNRNLDALKAFQDRKVNGMNLSDRVWNLKGQLKSELEMGIDVGLSDGRSADQLSRDIRGYLNEPNKLFRRVRDSRGRLQLSRNARSYHPGQGVYRSSYKNARRLAATETNMAYRASDHERMKELDFIAGFEVKLSNNHPVSDICDDLKGKYPKDFKFVGWHPHCRCHVISILATKEEIGGLTDNILNGDPTDGFTSVNTVGDVPPGFSSWVAGNRERAANWKSQPYFVRDNFKGGTMDGGLNLGGTKSIAKTPAVVKPDQGKKPKAAPPEVKTVDQYRDEIKQIFSDSLGINPESVVFDKSLSIEQIKRRTEHLRSLLSEYQPTTVYDIKSSCKVLFKSTKRRYGELASNTDGTLLDHINFGHLVDKNRVDKGKRLFAPKSRVDAENLDVSTLTHEFAHLITIDRQQIKYMIDDRLREFMPELRTLKSQYSRELNALSREGKHDLVQEMYLGDYASKNVNEFMAEAFTEYKLSSNPSKYAKLVGKLIDDTFKIK